MRGWMWPGSQRLANQGQGAWPGAVNQEILDSYSSVGPLRGTTTTVAQMFVELHLIKSCIRRMTFKVFKVFGNGTNR